MKYRIVYKRSCSLFVLQMRFLFLWTDTAITSANLKHCKERAAKYLADMLIDGLIGEVE